MTQKLKAVENQEDGSIDFVDEAGTVVQRSKPSKYNIKRRAAGKPPMKKMKGHFRWKENKNGVCLLVPYDMEAKNLPDDWTLFKYKHELCLNIAHQIAQGETISSVARMEGMPPAITIFNWYYKDPEFKRLIDEARLVRAEFYHDKVAEVADEVDEDTAKSAKVKIDAFKHLAAVGDRDRFGQQTKVVGHMEQTVTFVIDTGIHDEPIEVEGRTLNGGTERAAIGDGAASDSGGRGRSGGESGESGEGSEAIDWVSATPTSEDDSQESEKI